MKLTALLVTAILAAGLGNCSKVQAQSGTSPNLVNMSTDNSQLSLTGTTNYTGVGGGLSGGSTPGYNSTTNTIYFGYQQGTAAYTYAFSQALQNSGMTITGYNYAWDYYNQGMSAGTLSAKVNFASTTGTSLYAKSWTLGTTTDWTTISGTENFTNNLLASNIANFSLSFTGKDARFWAGYYGPMVKNPSLSLNYTFDVCSSDPLSSPSCPGYAAAYLTQQCTANPLYNSACPGYAQALLTQQCTADPLSNPSCPGYAAAYLTYQCSVNPLYSTTCPGYEQAYFNKQCDLDGLYSTRCPNYSVAYAKKMLLEQQGIAGTVATAGVIAQTAPTTTTATTTVSNDGTVSTSVSSTGNTTVDKALPPPATTANTAAAPAAPVQLVQPAPAPAAPQQQAQQERKPEGPRQEGPGGQQPMQAQGPQGGDKPQPTARQEIQAKRQEAARKDAVEKGKNLANEMGKAADMEQQKAVQNVVIQAMGFTPGFDTYNKVFIPDTVGYKPFTVYANQKTVDNRRLGMGLYGPSDRLHNDLVESQYNRGE